MSYTLDMPTRVGETRHMPTEPTVLLGSPLLERHPSFPDGLPAIVAEPRERSRCGDCEVIEHAISIGLDVERYVALQWEHHRATHARAAR